MRNQLVFLLLLSSSVVAQEPVYQPFETDSTAKPRGGILYLNTFLEANLRKPVAVEAKGTGGRVFVSGIVETDGRVTDVNVTQSAFPELNQEAIRVFTLFKAWQPAQKAGKAVRQQLSFPVVFKPNAPFTYIDGAQVSYFDAANKPVDEGSDQVRYRQVAPLDAQGMPTGDIIVYRKKGTGWKEEYRSPLVRQKSAERTPSGGPAIYLIGYQNRDKQWQGTVFGVDDRGALANRVQYENGRPSGLELTYHPNGVLHQRTMEADGKRATTSWHPNGQIKQIELAPIPKLMVANVPGQVTALWDSTGQPLVQEGNGRALYVDMRKSFSDTTRQTRYVEQGVYANGLKEGVWTGRCADGSYFYEERYDKGICQGGKAITAGSDTVRYGAQMEQPVFDGGVSGLGKFLAQNLRYPPDAQRARVQGRVYVSFVVCTDGTLCDYEVIQSVNPSLDQEAVRAVKAMSGLWKPGTYRGQKIRVRYRMPVAFTLE